MIIHHAEIARRIKPRYSRDDLRDLYRLFDTYGTLRFAQLPSGLYPAVSVDPQGVAVSGYGNVWVRDNVYVALAHASAGRFDEASRTIEALAAFYRRYRHRFEAIVGGDADPAVPMNRPQVRFDG